MKPRLKMKLKNDEGKENLLKFYFHKPTNYHYKKLAYYLYVVCANDTYENIAKAYNMDEKVIRDYNNNLSLDVGQILIIPYDSKTDTNKV